jgi:hypothetical protein
VASSCVLPVPEGGAQRTEGSFGLPRANRLPSRRHEAAADVPKGTMCRDRRNRATSLTSLPERSFLAFDPPGGRVKFHGGAHTRLVSEVQNDLRELADLGPQFVQRRLCGENLRLFWIAGEPFCFHLQSTSLDYRQDGDANVAFVQPPPELLAPAWRLVQRIGFDFCALDFRCERGLEQPVFLEINSFPMFVRFDDAADNRLVDAMLDFLALPPSRLR